MEVELKQCELKVGMYVTILNSKGDNNSFKGDVLKILAVDLPFVVVRCCNSSLTGPITFDIRTYGLKELSPEYVEQALDTTETQ